MPSIILHLREGRCIQGAARTRHGDLVNELLSRDAEPSHKEADEVELLAEFLEVTDFTSLRGQRPDLDGRSEVVVHVAKTAPGLFVVDILDREGS